MVHTLIKAMIYAVVVALIMTAGASVGERVHLNIPTPVLLAVEVLALLTIGFIVGLHK